MGKVLDVYWKWAKLGDTYLGRCIAGMDPDGDDFDLLPPHFVMKHEHAMKNPHIREGMKLCFGPILEAWGSKCAIEGILLLLLASMVYHSEFLMTSIAANSAHPFQSIPILQQTDLLEQLKELVTIKETGDITKATGVPRHVRLWKRITEIVRKLDGCMDKMDTYHSELPQMIADAIDAKAAESGHVTAQFVLEKLQEHSGVVTDVIRHEMKVKIVAALKELDLAPREAVPNPAQEQEENWAPNSSWRAQMWSFCGVQVRTG